LEGGGVNGWERSYTRLGMGCVTVPLLFLFLLLIVRVVAARRSVSVTMTYRVYRPAADPAREVVS
jgi:hypothetical protein